MVALKYRCSKTGIEEANGHYHKDKKIKLHRLHFSDIIELNIAIYHRLKSADYNQIYKESFDKSR